MKKLIVVLAMAVAASYAMAQEKADKPEGAGRRAAVRQMRPAMDMPPGLAMRAGAGIARVLFEKSMLSRIGVVDEAVQNKIAGELAPLKEKSVELEKKIREASDAQFQQMRGLLEDKAGDPKAAYDKIEEVAKLRAEQGGLSVQALVVLRDNLTAEQLEKVRKMIFFSQNRERGHMRRTRGGGERLGAGRPPKGPPPEK